MNIIYDYVDRDCKHPDKMGINPATDMKQRGFSWREVHSCTPADAIKFVNVSGDTSNLPSYLTVQK